MERPFRFDVGLSADWEERILTRFRRALMFSKLTAVLCVPELASTEERNQ